MILNISLKIVKVSRASNKKADGVTLDIRGGPTTSLSNAVILKKMFVEIQWKGIFGKLW